MSAYTTFASEGAITTSTRPHGLAGMPLLVCELSSAQVLPPSAERKRLLPLFASGPSPPERKVQPARRKSHIPAKRTSGFAGSIARPEQPVERFEPASTRVQLFPPSVVLYTPRSLLSLQSLPGTQA